MPITDCYTKTVTSQDFPAAECNKLIGGIHLGTATHYGNIPNNAGIYLRTTIDFSTIPADAEIKSLQALWHGSTNLNGVRALFSFEIYSPGILTNLITAETPLTTTPSWYQIPGFTYVSPSPPQLTAAIRNPSATFDFGIVSRAAGWYYTYLNHIFVRVDWNPAKSKTNSLFFGTNF